MHCISVIAIISLGKEEISLDENKIIPYIEPILRFCRNRLKRPHDAEDLASEIICCVLEGMEKYKIESFEAWVWRVAHNRYARFIDVQSKNRTVFTENDAVFDIAEENSDFSEREEAELEFERVFKYLHTLSCEYRNIFVDFYIGEMSIKMLAKKYSLPETTIKWRLNVGRQKIRKRITDTAKNEGENNMDKVYSRINWYTECCNGNMDSGRYLNSQISRAICKAAYENPLTVEEISMVTGIPTMYIEDEIPRLEYGDALCKIGNKYATNFIVFSLENRKQTESASNNLINSISDSLEALLKSRVEDVKALDFYGHDFGMERLGFIIIPYVLRNKIWTVKNSRLKLENGRFPLRTDGGYGWFIVEETEDENENCFKYNAGCNCAVTKDKETEIYYYLVAKYFDYGVYADRGTRYLCESAIIDNAENGCIAKNLLSDDDAASLIKNNLIIKAENGYKLNFPCFKKEEFENFVSLFNLADEALDDLLTNWIISVKNSFTKFVPKRLESQINQWVSTYLVSCIGYVTDELIKRKILKTPSEDRPLTDGVFCIKGKHNFSI